MTVEPLEYRPPEGRRSHSRAGIVSMLLGAVSLIGLFLSLRVPAGGRSAQSSFDPSPAVAIGIALACLACPVLGAILGVIGVRSKERKRVTAVVGLCLNGLVLLALAGAVAFAVFATG